jgi:hypothetical protein
MMITLKQQQQAVLLAGQMSGKQGKTQLYLHLLLLSQQQMQGGCLHQPVLLGCASKPQYLLNMLQQQIQDGGTITSSSSSMYSWAAVQATCGSPHQLLQLLLLLLQLSASTALQQQHQLLQVLLHMKLCMQYHTNHLGISDQRQHLRHSAAAGMTGSSRGS